MALLLGSWFGAVRWVLVGRSWLWLVGACRCCISRGVEMRERENNKHARGRTAKEEATEGKATEGGSENKGSTATSGEIWKEAEPIADPVRGCGLWLSLGVGCSRVFYGSI